MHDNGIWHGCFCTSCCGASALAALRRETFPLLMDPVSYSPDTLDIWSNRPEMDYWLSILGEQVDDTVEKAIASEGNSPGVPSTVECKMFS